MTTSTSPQDPNKNFSHIDQDFVNKLENDIKQLLKDVKRKANINRGWDLTLTITSVVFTLAITVVGILGEDTVGKNFSKIFTGTLGAALVAIQSVGSSIPIKQRSGGYRVLEAQVINLEFELAYKQLTDGGLDNEELKTILDKFYDLRKESAKLEADVEWKKTTENIA